MTDARSRSRTRRPRPAARPAAGGGRWVEVDPERLAGWLERVDTAHGGSSVALATDGSEVVVTATDGTVAHCRVPFPPLPPLASSATDPRGVLVAHALAERRVGVLLFRLGGHATGVFEGPRLVASKVGSRQVHGRSSAGGWSQQRFARRREGQVAVAVRAAADTAVALLLPWVGRLDAVVLGGDRSAVAAVLEDARLRPLLGLVVAEPFLDVPDPRQRVLETVGCRLRAVRIRVVDAPEHHDGEADGASA